MKWQGFLGKLLPRAVRQQLFFRELRKAGKKLGLTGEQMDKLLGGWKTKTGGILGILTGATMIINEVHGGTFDFEKIMTGVGIIAGSLAALGLGGKIEKNTAAVLATSDSFPAQAVATEHLK